MLGGSGGPSAGQWSQHFWFGNVWLTAGLAGRQENQRDRDDAGAKADGLFADPAIHHGLQPLLRDLGHCDLENCQNCGFANQRAEQTVRGSRCSSDPTAMGGGTTVSPLRLGRSARSMRSKRIRPSTSWVSSAIRRSCAGSCCRSTRSWRRTDSW